MTCEWCTEPFAAKRSDARYCTPRCKAAARYARDRERAAVDPAFAEALRARNRTLAARWSARHPEYRRSPARQAAQRAAASRYNRSPKGRDTKRANRIARRTGGRTPIDPLIVLELCDGACGLCGGDVDLGDFHIDHIIPVALGGDGHLSNLQVAHPACNRRKGVEA